MDVEELCVLKEMSALMQDLTWFVFVPRMPQQPMATVITRILEWEAKPFQSFRELTPFSFEKQ